MQKLEIWLSQRQQHRQAKREQLANEIAHRLKVERTGETEPKLSPEEAEQLAAFQEQQTAAKIAANPLRRIAWSSKRQATALLQSKNPIILLPRFFVWEIPKWTIASVQVLLQSNTVKLLAVPVFGAIITTATTINEREEKEQIKTFDEYISQIDKLTFEHGLLSEEPSPGAIVLARGRTLATLYKLDAKRRKNLVAFIYTSGLHKGKEEKAPILSFEFANLEKLDFRQADFRDFHFRHAYFWKSKLQQTTFQNADLRETRLMETDLRESDLGGADLREAVLRKADLRKAWLQDTDLKKANLKDAKLKRANLEGADLRATNLEGASFTGANLKDANLTDALIETNDEFLNIFLSNSGLETAYLCNTTMPDGEIRNDNCGEKWADPYEDDN